VRSPLAAILAIHLPRHFAIATERNLDHFVFSPGGDRPASDLPSLRHLGRRAEKFVRVGRSFAAGGCSFAGPWRPRFSTSMKGFTPHRFHAVAR